MYFYHAHAIALGEGFPESTTPLISHAPCSLSMGGGSSSSSAGKFDNGVVSYESAQCSISSRVDTSGKKKKYCCGVNIAVTKLNFLNMFTADQIVARVTSEHEFEPGDTSCSAEPDIIITGSYFDNLKIAGHPVTVNMVHDIFHDLPTYAKCQADWADEPNSKLRGILLGRGITPVPGPADPWHLQQAYTGCQNQLNDPSLKKTVLCSFVKDVSISSGGEIKTWGPIVKVPHFGTIYLGEVLICPGHRRVNMFRLHMGSPDGGDYIGPSGGSNGTGYP